MSEWRVAEVAPPRVARPRRAADQTMTRLRPMRSATMPAKGAARATPKVAAVTVRLTAALPTWKRVAKSGRMGWVTKRLRKAQKPASTTGAVRGEGAAGESKRDFSVAGRDA